jgi:hypothetical protein
MEKMSRIKRGEKREGEKERRIRMEQTEIKRGG